jgi:flagellar assembly protein FliH
MGAPAKFLFDLDFSAPESAQTRAPSAAETAEAVASAEARGYRNGYEAAQREIMIENERRTAQALGDISSGIAEIAARFNGVEMRLETESVDVAVAVARKLSGALFEREPLASITALVTECLRQLVATPHLVVRLNDALYEVGRVEIEKLAKQNGFQGRLVILAEPDIASGDCKIEWADGGVVLDRAATQAKIDDLVARFLTARASAQGILT